MNNYEYQIFIGLRDSQADKEIVQKHELIAMASQFFSRREIDFTLFEVQGGYLHDDNRFITENSLCINIVEPSDFDIMKLAKSLNMYMNQECSLIIRNKIKSDFIRGV